MSESSHHEDTHTVKSFREHTDEVREESSIGQKLGEGVQYAVSQQDKLPYLLT